MTPPEGTLANPAAAQQDGLGCHTGRDAMLAAAEAAGARSSSS